MPNYVTMPSLSDTMTEGTLVKWLVKVGDSVEFGDPLAEVETDKATMQMTAFDDGTIGAIYLDEGKKVPVGENLAIILEDGEELPEGDPPPAAAPAESSTEAEETSPDDAPASAPSATTTAAPGGGRIKASPLARKIAAADGIDLASITGSGPGGRIVKKDLAGGSQSAPAAAASPAPAAAAITPTKPALTTVAAMPASAEDQRIPLTGMRTIIAERLLLSKTTIPHFYLTVEVDAEPLMTLRKQANAAAEVTGNKFTVNDFVLKAVAGAAVAVPQVNASFDGDAIVQYGSVQLCVAIAVEDGLVTPVIRDAQTKSLLEISKSVKDLAARAKDKKLSPDEFAGGTITVSNLGAYGIESFDAIINPPQACILSISAARKTPVVDDAGNIVAGMRMKVGMSCDHRVVDGAVGATYLAEFRKLIENPASMLV